MDDSKLIELVREHPSIFNAKHHDHKNTIVRENVWKKVAGSLNQPVEECKNRWKNIRDTFMRRKRNSKLPTGSATSQKPRKWYLEDHLEFLKLVEYERQTMTNTVALETNDFTFDNESQTTEVQEIEETPENGEHNTAIETLTETNLNEETSIENPATHGEKDVRSALKRKYPTKTSGDNIIQLFKRNSEDRAKLLSTVLTKQKEEHPINVFFKSMAISVNKMSTANQINAKMQICQIVGKLELNGISSRQSTSSVSNYDVQTPSPSLISDTTSQTFPASFTDSGLEYMTNTAANFI